MNEPPKTLGLFRPYQSTVPNSVHSMTLKELPKLIAPKPLNFQSLIDTVQAAI